MYNDFALVYDRFQEIDYDKFVEFYQKIFKKFDVNPDKIIDLGCGSGSITVRLAKNKFNVIGMDFSDEMLTQAQNKAINEGLQILFLNQDMTNFTYPEKVQVVISSLDCINYLSDIEDVKSTFKCVHDVLDDDGIFIFDINSEYKLKEVLGNNTFVYEDDEAFCVWDCVYFSEDKVCGFDLNFFVKGEDDKYKRYFEYQEETVFTVDELKSAVEDAEMKVLGIFGDLKMSEPDDKTERIFFVLKNI